MTLPVYGFQSQLVINGVRYDFLRESLACNEEFVYTGGLIGTREQNVALVRQGIRRVAGQIEMQPTAVELATLLPWIYGGTPVSTNYPLADQLTAYTVEIARDDGSNGKVFSYSSCLVNRATFTARKGAPLALTLDVVGSDETVGNAGTRTVASLDLTTGPFILTDLTFKIATVPYACDGLELVLDNHVDTDRYFNSQVLSTVTNAMDRTITLNNSLPYGQATAAYATGPGGVAVDAKFINQADTNLTLEWSFVKVCYPRKSPTVQGRTEILVPLSGIAYKSATTSALVTTLADTP